MRDNPYRINFVPKILQNQYFWYEIYSICSLFPLKNIVLGKEKILNLPFYMGFLLTEV